MGTRTKLVKNAKGKLVKYKKEASSSTISKNVKPKSTCDKYVQMERKHKKVHKMDVDNVYVNGLYFKSFIHSKKRKNRLKEIVFSAHTFIKNVIDQECSNFSEDRKRVVLFLLVVMQYDIKKLNKKNISKAINQVIERHPKIFQRKYTVIDNVNSIHIPDLISDLEETYNSSIFEVSDDQILTEVQTAEELQQHIDMEDYEHESRKIQNKFRS